MHLFENSLLLLGVAVVLLQVSRRLGTPYPSMLALAGACVAAIPGIPSFTIEPHLALALFVTPALFDTAFDTSPRELKRNWRPLVALVFFAVVLTTAAVAWAGWAMAGLPIAAAVALGAIVAPPDAAAAAAVLSQFRLPRRAMTILQGESLLNDAVALFLFSAAVAVAAPGHGSFAASWPLLLLAVPGGALLGWLAGWFYLRVAPLVAGTLSSSIAEFVSTFGVWIIAERLHVSPIIATVVYAMILGHYWPSQQSPRDRVHAYAVW
ncbi:sodium:proton antiporter, partial [bacterium]